MSSLSLRPRLGVTAPSFGLTRALLVSGMCGAGSLVGALSAVKPMMAAALIVFGLVSVLAFRAPVANLLLLIVWTGVLPITLQSRFGSGTGGSGIVFSDLLMLLGLAWALRVLWHQRLDQRGTIALALTILFLGVDGLQTLHALQLGRSISGVGGEFRTLFGFSTTLIVIPLLSDPHRRRQLLRGLIVIGLVLGVWGVAQFLLGIQFVLPADQGGGSVATFNTAGRVVGLFGFPVATLLALAVLVSGQLRGRGVRLLLLAIVLLNLTALVLTFERSFFLATVLGILAILWRLRGRERLRLVVWTIGGFLAVFLVLVTLAPTVLSAYQTRLSSLGNYQTDQSVTYRVEESRMVSEQIGMHPLSGSGLGASILIGRPGTTVALAPRRYAENGYLWLAWKIGIPAAGVLCLLMALAILWPRRRGEQTLFAATRLGAQAALLAIGLVTISFGSFTQIAITPMLGVLVALCAAPRVMQSTRPHPANALAGRAGGLA
jgi:O-Antigen ligase